MFSDGTGWGLAVTFSEEGVGMMMIRPADSGSRKSASASGRLLPPSVGKKERERMVMGVCAESGEIGII